jgi:hypothetical protein
MTWIHVYVFLWAVTLSWWGVAIRRVRRFPRPWRRIIPHEIDHPETMTWHGKWLRPWLGGLPSPYFDITNETARGR